MNKQMRGCQGDVQGQVVTGSILVSAQTFHQLNVKLESCNTRGALYITFTIGLKINVTGLTFTRASKLHVELYFKKLYPLISRRSVVFLKTLHMHP